MKVINFFFSVLASMVLTLTSCAGEKIITPLVEDLSTEQYYKMVSNVLNEVSAYYEASSSVEELDGYTTRLESYHWITDCYVSGNGYYVVLKDGKKLVFSYPESSYIYGNSRSVYDTYIMTVLRNEVNIIDVLDRHSFLPEESVKDDYMHSGAHINYYAGETADRAFFARLFDFNEASMCMLFTEGYLDSQTEKSYFMTGEKVVLQTIEDFRNGATELLACIDGQHLQFCMQYSEIEHADEVNTQIFFNGASHGELFDRLYNESGMSYFFFDEDNTHAINLAWTLLEYYSGKAYSLGETVNWMEKNISSEIMGTMHSFYVNHSDSGFYHMTVHTYSMEVDGNDVTIGIRRDGGISGTKIYFCWGQKEQCTPENCLDVKLLDTIAYNSNDKAEQFFHFEITEPGNYYGTLYLVYPDSTGEVTYIASDLVFAIK